MKQVLSFITRCVEILSWLMVLGTVGRLDLDTVSLRDGLILIGLFLTVAALARFARSRLRRGRRGL